MDRHRAKWDAEREAGDAQGIAEIRKTNNRRRLKKSGPETIFRAGAGFITVEW